MSKITKYKVTEYDWVTGMKISDLFVSADKLDDVKLFAHNNRRHQRTTMKIHTGGELIATQKKASGKWALECAKSN